jgi:hypothetical protein
VEEDDHFCENAAALADQPTSSGPLPLRDSKVESKITRSNSGIDATIDNNRICTSVDANLAATRVQRRGRRHTPGTSGCLKAWTRGASGERGRRHRVDSPRLDTLGWLPHDSTLVHDSGRVEARSTN